MPKLQNVRSSLQVLQRVKVKGTRWLPVNFPRRRARDIGMGVQLALNTEPEIIDEWHAAHRHFTTARDKLPNKAAYSVLDEAHQRPERNAIAKEPIGRLRDLYRLRERRQKV